MRSSTLIPSTPISFLFLLLPLFLSSIPQSPSYSYTADAAPLLDQCAVSVAALFTDPRVNACIPINPLVQLANGTDITPKLVNDTSTTFCAMPFCNAATVALMENTMNQNCANSTEDTDANYWLYGVASLYVPFKQGMCQRVQTPPGNNGTFCITVLTDSINSYVKKHPNKQGWGILANSTQLQQYVDGIPTSTLCTDCTKAMINPLDTFVSIHLLTLDAVVIAWVRMLQTEVQRRCGENFIDGIVLQPQPTTSATPSGVESYRCNMSIPWLASLAVVLLASQVLLMIP
ncbi:hypothetical protein EDD21DRAFT_376288 [Dissophora ornata]|nr:hypothetical protein EDD21DRAFT_376288 [Dissophora ornata]